MNLPLRLTWTAASDRWASILNPFISNPALNSIILKSVSLTTGANVVNHLLGRNLQGWKITRMRNVAAIIYDTQDTNQHPDLTLNLNSSASVVVDIEVF